MKLLNRAVDSLVGRLAPETPAAAGCSVVDTLYCYCSGGLAYRRLVYYCGGGVYVISNCQVTGTC
jgi:hypothetical protein